MEVCVFVGEIGPAGLSLELESVYCLCTVFPCVLFSFCELVVSTSAVKCLDRNNNP